MMHITTRRILPLGTRSVFRRHGIPCATLVAIIACGEQGTDAALAPSSNTAEAAAGRWVMRANMPTDRINTTTATITDASGRTTLYVIGGRGASGSAFGCSGGLSKVQAYNAATNAWTTRAPFPHPIQHTNGAGVINGKIYLTGGCISFSGYRGWTWMYDPALNTWTQKAHMPVSRTWAGNTGVIQNKLYVLSSCDGQHDCGTHTNLFFGRYDPAADSWTTLPLPPGRAAHLFGGSAVIGGKFYVVAGFGSQSVEVYDPATNQWTTRAAMGSRRVHVASASVGGRLYVIAGIREGEFDPGTGEVPRTPVATTSMYNPVTNVWTNLQSAPRSGAGLSGGRVVVNGVPRVALVGGARPGNNHHFIP